MGMEVENMKWFYGVGSITTTGLLVMYLMNPYDFIQVSWFVRWVWIPFLFVNFIGDIIYRTFKGTKKV